MQRCPVFAEVNTTSAHFTGESICLAYPTAWRHHSRSTNQPIIARDRSDREPQNDRLIIVRDQKDHDVSINEGRRHGSIARRHRPPAFPSANKSTMTAPASMDMSDSLRWEDHDDYNPAEFTRGRSRAQGGGAPSNSPRRAKASNLLVARVVFLFHQVPLVADHNAGASVSLYAIGQHAVLRPRYIMEQK